MRCLLKQRVFDIEVLVDAVCSSPNARWKGHVQQAFLKLGLAVDPESQRQARAVLAYLQDERLSNP